MHDILIIILYSNEPRDQIFVKGYEYFSFAKNTDKSLSKNVSD